MERASQDNHAESTAPGTAEQWCARAATLLQAGSFAEALSAYETAASLSPEAAPAWYGKGTVLLKLGRFAEALSAFDSALEIAPGMAEAWRDKALVLAKLGRQEEGLKAFDRAMEALTKDALDDAGKGLLLGRYLADRSTQKERRNKDRWPFRSSKRDPKP